MITISVAPDTGQAPKQRTVWEGIYSEAQAARGEKAYKLSCGYCHKDNLAGGFFDDGNGRAPALAGPRAFDSSFEKRWAGETVGEMVIEIGTAMPQKDPGSLPPETYVDIISFLLVARTACPPERQNCRPISTRSRGSASLPSRNLGASASAGPLFSFATIGAVFRLLRRTRHEPTLRRKWKKAWIAGAEARWSNAPAEKPICQTIRRAPRGTPAISGPLTTPIVGQPTTSGSLIRSGDRTTTCHASSAPPRSARSGSACSPPPAGRGVSARQPSGHIPRHLTAATDALSPAAHLPLMLWDGVLSRTHARSTHRRRD